jgi:phosphatidylserine decarboxylase
MRIPIAREGYPLIASTAVPAVVLLDAAALLGGTLLWILALILSALALAVIVFFRDPERRGPRGDGLIIAPADGKVVDIRTEEESSFLRRKSLRISIFLSLLDVHVNRYPVSGRVVHRQHDAGRFEPAWRESASHLNERSSTAIHGAKHAILVRQIAGLAAKRIVTYGQVGDSVRQGERMGIIRFGSRVDVFLPEGSVLEVNVGDHAKGGLTVLARLPTASQQDS